MSRIANLLILASVGGATTLTWAQDCPYADSTAVPDTLDQVGYYPMQVGNMWAYANPNRENYEVFFSDEIVGDTLVEGVRFFQFVRQSYELWYDGWVEDPYPRVDT